MQLDGRSAIVTGGASGLGAATARNFAAAGARVTLFDRDEAGGTALAAEIGGTFAQVDVTDEASVAAGIAAASTVRRRPSNGTCPPGATACRRGDSASLRRIHAALSRAKSSASDSGARSGIDSVTRPSSCETRSENRLARALRRRVMSSGGSPGRVFNVISIAPGAAGMAVRGLAKSAGPGASQQPAKSL